MTADGRGRRRGPPRAPMPARPIGVPATTASGIRPAGASAHASASAQAAARAEVVEAGPRGERELGGRVAAEAEHDPFRDVEPADAARRRRASDRASSGTWRACTPAWRAARCARRSALAELGREPRRLGGAARVVPRDRGDHRARGRVEQHAGLGHARDADRGDAAARGAASASRDAPRSRRRRSSSGSSSAPVSTRRQGVGARPGRDLAAVGVERGGLDRRRADVEAEDEVRLTTPPRRRPDRAAGNGAPRTSPRSSPSPLAYGTSTTDAAGERQRRRRRW